MAKVQRVVVADGGWHQIEHAVRKDRTSPSEDFFEALGAGIWEPDPDAASLPDDSQVTDKAKFLAMCKWLAEYGHPMDQRRSCNDLEDGTWEFKRGSKRLSWYDTDGSGNYTAKLRIEDKADSKYPDSTWWDFPIHDEIIRLGFAFPKLDQTAGTYNINEVLETRKEDLEHDQ